MEHSILLLDRDLWIIINAVSDKASTYRFFAEYIRSDIKGGEAHPSHRLLAEMFDRQAENAERIRDRLAAHI